MRKASNGISVHNLLKLAEFDMDIDTYSRALRKLPRKWREADVEKFNTNVAFGKIVAVHPDHAPIFWNGVKWENLIGGMPERAPTFFQPRLFSKGK